MGLDMYLDKRTYVKNWDFMEAADRHAIEVRRGGEIRTDIKPERISQIIERVAYWRKANAIHRWFVEQVQGGNDDCGEYRVTREKLAELLAACKQVLGCVESVAGKVHVATSYIPDGEGGTKVEEHFEEGEVVTNAAMAERILPTQAGCFFGSTTYDTYYFDDLRNTVAQLEPLLAEGGGDFYYHSSW